METLVLPLGTIPTAEGDAFALLAELPTGLITMMVGQSWADAAARLAPQLGGQVTCDETLATVGRRFGWTVVTPTQEQHLLRAAIALGVVAELPAAHDVLLEFVKAWIEFYRLELWEQMPAEMSLRMIERSGKKEAVRAVAVMGQARIEWGFAFYEDPRAFDAVWNGEHFPMTGISVLADEDPYLLPAFQPFGVPPPVVTRIVKHRPRAPGVEDFVLGAASMQLLLNVLTGEFDPLPIGPGVTLELMRDEPKKKRKPKKRAARPKPKPKPKPKKKK